MKTPHSIILLSQNLLSAQELGWLPVVLLSILVVLLVCSLCTICVLYRKNTRNLKRVESLELALERAHRQKVTNVANFLEFCSAYLERYNEFGRLARRKIKSGQVDDLYQMLKSNRISEAETREFLLVFDHAFLYIFPTFVDDVNRLLRDDCRFIVPPDGPLPTEIRILAFIRIGVTESSKLAKFLGLSINTIYTYRNKMRGWAIERDSFESLVTAIAAAE